MLQVWGGSWNGSFCTAQFASPSQPTPSYSITVELFSTATAQAPLGLLYNIQDTDNYDFVYFR